MVRIVAFPIEHCDVKLIFGICGQTTLPPSKCILLDMVFIVFHAFSYNTYGYDIWRMVAKSTTLAET
jgi:hypothetical protein